MTPQRPLKVSVRGNVNKGFEMSSAEEGKDAGHVVSIEETAIEVQDESDSEKEDVHDDGPHTLKIRRVSFHPPADDLPPASSKVKHSAPGTEEKRLSDCVENKNGDVEKVTTGSGESESYAAAADDPSFSSKEKTDKPAEIQSEERKQGSSNMKFDLKTKDRIRVHIQGPYGTPSTSIFESEHAVLIGAGIGVTPYASILQSIIYRHHSILNECPNCNHSWVDRERQERALRVNKVDFIWLNRNYMAFEWFVDMLLQLENEQSHYSLDRFLDIHLFMTGMKRFDMKNIGLQMALDLVHEKEDRDLLTGLRTKLQAGRPDWKKLFDKLKSENKGKVSVYFCGAPALAAVISNHCNDFNFTFHKESF